MLMARTVQDSMQFRRSKWRLPQKGIQRPCVEGQGRCEQGHAYRLEDATVKQRGTGVKEQGDCRKSLPFYPQKPFEGAAARLQAMAVASQGAKAAPPSRGTSDNGGQEEVPGRNGGSPKSYTQICPYVVFT